MQATQLLTSTTRNQSGLPIILRLPMLAFLVVFMVGLTGCYSQLAIIDAPHDGIDQMVVDYGDDGDVLVRKYYEDGYVEEEVYDEYDWYYHRPYGYARYFDSFYDPYLGGGYCWDIMYCSPSYGYSSFTLGFGFGTRYWGAPYYGLGFGYNNYSPYSFGYGGISSSLFSLPILRMVWWLN